MRIIAVNTGTKYSEWFVDNLKHMIDTYSNLKYDSFEVIRDDIYDDDRGVFNKLLMFKYFTDDQNIYFDLDMLIKGDCNNFLRKDFTLCHAHWREEYHTPLNSSIMSWAGNHSYIFEKFESNPEYYMMKYNRGIDQFIYENIKYKTYNKEDGYCSFQTVLDEQDYPVYLFNQRNANMKNKDWYSRYFINV
jgi:hypothetical protein